MPSEFNLFKFMPEGYTPYQALIEEDYPVLDLSLNESMEYESSEIIEDLQKGLTCAKPAENQDISQDGSEKGSACAKPAEDQHSSQDGSEKGSACAKPAEDQHSSQDGSEKGLACAKPAEDQDSSQDGSKKGLACAKPAEDQDSSQDGSKKGSAYAKPVEDQDSVGLCSKSSKVLVISKTKDDAGSKKYSDIKPSKSKKKKSTHCTGNQPVKLYWSGGQKPSEYFANRKKTAKKPYDAELHKHTVNYARALDAQLRRNSSVRFIISVFSSGVMSYLPYSPGQLLWGNQLALVQKWWLPWENTVYVSK